LCESKSIVQDNPEERKVGAPSYPRNWQRQGGYVDKCASVGQ